MIILTKLCSKCKIEKKLTEFNKGTETKLGYKSSCRECQNKAERERYHTKEKFSEDYKRRTAESKKKYRQTENGKQKRKEWDKKYKQRHPEKEIQRRQQPIYKLRSNLRGRFRKAIHRNMLNENASMTKESLDMLGCSVVEYKAYLEGLFTDGMSWNNYGEWHIDHIRPIASFDLSKLEKRVECFNYKNTQPLWALDNLIKGDKYEFNTQTTFME